MRRREFVGRLVGYTALLAALISGAAAQTPKRLVLLRDGPPPDNYLKAFIEELAKLGYEEHKNFEIEYRFSDRQDQLRAVLPTLKPGK
jgi:hypothetical protein